jgi:hypothetical protein
MLLFEFKCAWLTVVPMHLRILHVTVGNPLRVADAVIFFDCRIC